MNDCCRSRSTRTAGLFSFGLLDGMRHIGYQERARLATACMNIPISYTYTMPHRTDLSPLCAGL
ncbi:MAG: hypothetical protein H0W13_05375 [Nitrospirales bacterium]|nr:hypothetical protein [Nitrospirales bacterium]